MDERNGDLPPRYSTADISDTNDSNPFILGGMMTCSGIANPFQGGLQELEFYNRVETNTEIVDSYDDGMGYFSQRPDGGAAWAPGDGGLVACFHMDEGSGTTIHDSSGNGLDGTLLATGTSWTTGPVNYSSATVSTGLLPVGTDTLTAQYMGQRDLWHRFRLVHGHGQRADRTDRNPGCLLRTPLHPARQ